MSEPKTITVKVTKETARQMLRIDERYFFGLFEPIRTDEEEEYRFRDAVAGTANQIRQSLAEQKEITMRAADREPTLPEKDALCNWVEFDPIQRLEALAFLIEASVYNLQQMGSPTNEADESAFTLLMDLHANAVYEIAQALEKKAGENRRA